MDNNKLKILVAVALVLGLLGGYMYGSTSGYGRGYAVGYEKSRGEIKQRLVDTKLIEPTPQEIKIVSGTVKSLGDNRFVLESRLPYDPTLPRSEQGGTVTRTVIVTADTGITIRTVEVSNQKAKPGEPIRPFVVKNVKADFKSIVVGDQVVVESNENIADKTEFEASLIFLNGK